MIGYFFWLYVFGYVVLSLVFGFFGNFLNYLMFCDNFFFV